MTRISRIATILLAGASLPMLAACGADDIASPGGQGPIIVNPDNGGGSGGGSTSGFGEPITDNSDARLSPNLADYDSRLAAFISATGGNPNDREAYPVIEFDVAAASGAATPQTVRSTAIIVRLPERFDSNVTIPYVEGVIYLIDGQVNVGSDVGGTTAGSGGDPVNVTIEPGVIIMADNGEGLGTGGTTFKRVTRGSTAPVRTDVTQLSTSATYNQRGPDYMIVNRGSKLFAQGQPTRPIIFTARQNVEGTATDTGVTNAQGLWGGLILAGRAPISDCSPSTVPGGTAACERIVEGTGTARYGGEVAADSSGVLQYVQIRYSGITISPNNELQGLTPAGVGSGTVISHVQVHNSADDGVEIFGGRMNAKNLLITGADDDDLDTDVGYQGAVQFVLGIKRSDNGSSDPRNLEVDSSGNEDAGPRQYLRLANFTFYHPMSTAQSLYLRGGADATLVNGIVDSTTRACIDIDGSQTVRAADSTIVDANSVASPDAGPPVFHSIYFDCPTGVENDNESGNLTQAAVQALFTAGTNNVLSGTAALTSLFLPNGAASPALPTAFNAATLNRSGETFLVNTDYIGAVRDANDTWYKGWTCTPSYATQINGLGTCVSIPSYS